MSTVATKKWFVAVCLGYWGRGATAQEAKKEMRIAGGDFRHYVIYEIDSPVGKDKPSVNGWGCICYYGEQVSVTKFKNGKVVA